MQLSASKPQSQDAISEATSKIVGIKRVANRWAVDTDCFLCETSRSELQAIELLGMETPDMSESLSLEDEIVVALRRITRAIDLRSRTLLQDYGLTVPQLMTLQTIARLQPVMTSAIAKRIHLGQPTVTGILNRLENRRLIRRIRGDQDRRSVNVSLTDEGERILSDAPSPLQDQFQQELSKLKEWERTQILATLQHIADMMDATGIKAVPVLSSALADVTAGETVLHPDKPPPQVTAEQTTAEQRTGAVNRGLLVGLKSSETTDLVRTEKVRG